jgi:hypothetical protein
VLNQLWADCMSRAELDPICQQFVGRTAQVQPGNLRPELVCGVDILGSPPGLGDLPVAQLEDPCVLALVIVMITG